MKIALAADHAGFGFKEKLAAELRRWGHEPIDFGTKSTESCDYPDFAIPAVRSVGDGDAQRGILCCTNGIGMCMIANRVGGVRGALAYSARTAATTRQHHDSNVLCLGAGEFPAESLLEWVRIWLDTPFEGGRHERRIGKIQALEPQ
jgi:ribose 5-phosphate isomerase B